MRERPARDAATLAAVLLLTKTRETRMPDPYSVASPHPAYQIVAQFHAPGERWVYRVFGPEAAWCGTFKSAADLRKLYEQDNKNIVF